MAEKEFVNLQAKLVEKLVNKKFEYWKEEFIKIVEEIVTRRCKGTSANCYEIKKEIKERAGVKLTQNA